MPPKKSTPAPVPVAAPIPGSSLPPPYMPGMGAPGPSTYQGNPNPAAVVPPKSTTPDKKQRNVLASGGGALLGATTGALIAGPVGAVIGGTAGAVGGSAIAGRDKKK